MKIRLPLILLLNVAGVALFLSWFLPANHGFWYAIDTGVFTFFNQQLAVNRPFLWFVAITNNRAFDGCSLLAMGALMLWHWRRAAPAQQRRIVLMGLVMLLAAVVLNQLGQRLLPVTRPSPTLTFTGINRVSELLSISTKDASTDSFPGDHGMILLIFAGFMWRYFGQKAFAIALLIFAVFALPRMMIGAHWFTNIFVGSLCVVLTGLPWCLLTPVSDKVIDWFDRTLPRKKQTI